MLLFGIVLIKAPGFVLTADAVRTSIYLKRLGISLLFSAFRPDMAQLSSIMAEVIRLIFKDGIGHVVILSDIFLVGAGLSFLMVLEFDVALDSLPLRQGSNSLPRSGHCRPALAGR